MTTLEANYGSIATVESNTNHLVSKKAEAGTECCICSIEFNGKEMGIGHTAFNVDHLFHIECLKKWWNKGKHRCPICRAHLTDSKNRLNKLTSSQKCCIGVALSLLCSFGTVMSIALTLGYISRIQ